MVSPGKLTVLTALADRATTAYKPSLVHDTGEVRYPDAARLLNNTDAPASDVLESFAQRNLLAKSFEEKVYICPGCNTDGIQYTTACPSCGSAYTIETELFDHVACGHIAPRDRFEVGPEEFICPECEAQFDSLERVERGIRYVCQECQSYFKMPEHGLRCRDCADIYPPSETIERVLCRYVLTDSGRRWVKTQLAARESLSETLAERGFDTTTNTSVEGESGTEYPVHVFAEDALLDSRIVAAIHERPAIDDATVLREIAPDTGAHPILVTTCGTVGEQVAALAEQTDIHIITAQAEGRLAHDYEVTDNP
jgi:predicted amidophosphoribosyltransferase